MFDFITIGSATLDAFIETDDAAILSVSTQKGSAEYMAYSYGSKLEINKFNFTTGGGGLNTALNFATLGYKTTTILKIGDSPESKNIFDVLKKGKVDNSNIVLSKDYGTGFSVILLSFQGDRTVLAHRGANGAVKVSDINFDSIKKSKWLYIAPLNGKSTEILDKIAIFAEENDVNMAINVGTSSIKKGEKYLKKILETAEVVILNLEEAQMLTKIDVRPDSKTEKFSTKKIHPDIVTMLEKLKSTNAKIVIITNGKKGVYAYDGKNFYYCPEFPAKVISTLGAGDAFSSTFVATLEHTKWDIKKSLEYASVVAASTVEQFGAQDGFMTFKEIEAKLKKVSDFKAEKIKV